MQLVLKYEPPIFVAVGRPLSDNQDVLFSFFGFQKILNDFYYNFEDFQSGRINGLRPAESLDTCIFSLINNLHALHAFFERTGEKVPSAKGAFESSAQVFGRGFFSIVKDMRNSIAHMEDYLFSKKSMKASTGRNETLGIRVENGGLVNLISGYDESRLIVRGLRGNLLELNHSELMKKVAMSSLVLKAGMEKCGYSIEIRGIEIISRRNP